MVPVVAESRGEPLRPDYNNRARAGGGSDLFLRNLNSCASVTRRANSSCEEVSRVGGGPRRVVPDGASHSGWFREEFRRLRCAALDLVPFAKLRYCQRMCARQE